MNVFDFPKDHPIRAAHGHSFRNRAEIERSSRCGCFDCLSVFQPGEITNWTDTENLRGDQTAICPKCGTDAVIGDKSGFEPTPEFLKGMHEHWCAFNEDE